MVSGSNANKYKKLAKNSVIFLIGNFGSKVISFFIVPFYTYFLTTQEYGTADLITTTVNLLAPFAMMGMNEAVLRFSASQEDRPELIASNAMLVVIAGWIVCWALLPVFRTFSVIGDNVVLFLLLLCLTSFNSVFLQLLRGLGQSKAFAANGVVITFVTAVANVISLAVLHTGVEGYLASMIIAQLIGAVQIIVCSRLWNLLARDMLNKVALKKMLIYCIPLIPNSLMWWIMSASDRYVVLLFLGASANGIYNVAQKVPSIVNVVYGVFMQAWQVSAIEERNSESNASFQSTVFQYMFIMLAIVSSLIAASAYPVNTFLMSSAYEESWQPVAMLSLANFFSCVGAFFGVTYVVTKESKRAFITAAFGAVVNVVLTLCLVPAIGIMGAAIATAISYFAVAVIRGRDTRKFVHIKFKWNEIIPSITVLLVQTSISFLPYNPVLLAVNFLFFGLLLIVLRRDLKNLLSLCLNFLHKRKNKKGK